VIRKRGITLRSYPRERATLITRLVVGADRVTVAGLNLDGSEGAPCRRSAGCYPREDTLPSPTVNGSRVRISGNDITNRHGICVVVARYYGLRTDLFRIERNRIHDCRPATNHIHGIYVTDGRHGLIRDNVIYNNGDKGIVLYPNAQDELVEGNTIDGNRTGVHFGGGYGTASSDNTVSANIVTFPRPRDGWPARFNVEAYWPGPAGSRNLVRGNCLFTDASDDYFTGDPRRSGVMPSAAGVSVSGIVARNPRYVHRGGGDYRLAADSPCAGMGAPPEIAAADAWCAQVDPPGSRRAYYRALWGAAKRTCFGPKP
jgi:parallel beta-helix repeat protein